MKRSNGEGSVFKNKSGKWVAQVTYYEAGKRKRKTRTSKTRSDANANLRKLHEEIESGFSVISGTVSQYLVSWVEVVKRENTENTYLSIDGIVERHILPILGKKQLKKLSPIDVQSMIDKLRENGIGSRSVQLAYCYLNMAMARAYSLRMIPENPCGPVKKPKHLSAKAQPYSEEEVKAILDSLKGDQFYNMIYVGLTTGMRPGELFGLFWEHVDLDKLKIKIVQQLSNAGGRKTLKDPKTKSSFRTIEISESTANALHSQRKQNLKQGYSSSDFVFIGRNGSPVGYTNFQKRWNKMQEDAGVEPRGFHQVRHTFATLAISGGVPITVISETLGHSKTSTTLDIYAHVMPTQRSDATNAVSRIIG